MAHRCSNGCGTLIPSNDWHTECENCRANDELMKMLQEERNEQDREYNIE